MTRTQVRVAAAPFGVTADGDAVEVYTIQNARGYELRAMTYGGVILSLRVPDRDGRFDDIVLGHDELRAYLTESPYFGAIIGRYGNRIAGGHFVLEGVAHQLATNDPPNHLHGGIRGFDKRLWRAETFEHEDGAGIGFRLTSPDGEEGYPGSVTAAVSYTLTNSAELVIDYHATTDRPTPINLTQHSYFNLAGAGAGDVLQHELTILADYFTPIDTRLIPLGHLASVAGTAFDFRSSRPIGERIALPDDQLRRAGGYDHNFVLRQNVSGLAHAARLAEPTSGRTLDIFTSQPGLQFYSGNFLDGRIRGKSGRSYGHRSGVCLETQHFPNSPNEPLFPTTVLRPGDSYRSRTKFVFGVTG
ncbi:MAG: galactose mutarotase [Gemmatimonadaceae bacterium]